MLVRDNMGDNNLIFYESSPIISSLSIFERSKAVSGSFIILFLDLVDSHVCVELS